MTAPAPLPGMPMRVGDPGVFVCGPRDIAPWEDPERLPAVPPAPAPRPRRRAWLVLSICEHCNVATGRYCTDHGPRNWWLENYRPR